MHCRVKLTSLIVPFLFICFLSCRHRDAAKEKDMVADPAKMDDRVQENILSELSAAASGDMLHDSTVLNFYPVLKYYYDDKTHLPLWSSKEKWTGNANALVSYLKNAAANGLFAADYHFSKIKEITALLDRDSLKRGDAVLWARADLLMTDAFTGLLRDLKQGRLQPDSLSWKYDTSKYSNYFSANMEKIRNGGILDSVLSAVEPTIPAYRSLKSCIHKFTDSMDSRVYTYLEYPYKDSVAFIRSFKKRMGEAGIMIPANADSATLSNIVKKYQKEEGLTVDGKIGNGVVKNLNLTDRQKFRTIAVTLDRYKSLPEKMPDKYIWVNLPAYYLKVWDEDTLVFESKVICGKPATPTPFLTSAISDIIIYPTWTVPTSIISKDMLPGLKRNPGYLQRKGLYLLNNEGGRVDPYSVNWAKYSKGIPYKIQQGSGDDNALGVIKFNFNNPFSVYLHDTNQRYLFKNSLRDLSHGCVRVQEWQKLADYIVRNDSLMTKRSDTLKYNTDSIRSWIAHKQKHTIIVKNRIPLFIKYFGCEAVNGAVKFYDDIYGDDRALAQKYFAGK
jgi:murein L,D-transpeptidase YcbB/YkuD